MLSTVCLCIGLQLSCGWTHSSPYTPGWGQQKDPGCGLSRDTAGFCSAPPLALSPTLTSSSGAVSSASCTYQQPIMETVHLSLVTKAFPVYSLFRLIHKYKYGLTVSYSPLKYPVEFLTISVAMKQCLDEWVPLGLKHTYPLLEHKQGCLSSAQAWGWRDAHSKFWRLQRANNVNIE